MNIIELKPVGKIILNENTPNRSPRLEHYKIPYYQRGYRWDEENVNALLEDIHNFMNSDEKKYCLQPIVIVPATDDFGLNIWEVIDGQQRLITMNIIFKYLNRLSYEIVFEKRFKSTEFLKNLAPETYNAENPDFHFMSQAYEIIKKWFEEKTKSDVGYIDDFNSTLTKRVEIIWYQIEELKEIAELEVVEDKKIDIFTRLNIGKIPLTDAELIRALLLSKIKFNHTDREAILRQSEISSEWHRIEMELRNEEFWYFLNDKPLEETSSTIEFIFKLISKNNTKKYSTYLWFEKEIKDENPQIEKENALKLWNKIKEYSSKLKYWFAKDSLYHHIGFLLAIRENSISSLRHIIDNSDCKKSAFEQWAFEEVKTEVADINLKTLSYEGNGSDILKVFLLHNIIASKSIKSVQKNRFPYNLFKKIKNEGGWSIEHVHAQQSIEMKDVKAIKEWLKETYSAIKEINYIEKTVKSESGEMEIMNIPVPEELKNNMLEMIKQEKVEVDVFNLLKTDLFEIFDSVSLHVLDNLALLSKRDNSSLNNSIFPVKRNRIIELEKEGKFIPPTTKNIFLKYYSSSNLQPYYWSEEDKKSYLQNIESQLKPYLNVANN
jgi:uncharacterized protein with ParB-like and HNH nuclease domain